MILVDNVLKDRDREGKPLRIGVIGSGFLARGIVWALENALPGMRAAAVYGRDASRAREVFTAAGVTDAHPVENPDQAADIVLSGGRVFSDNPFSVTGADGIDVVIEATGSIEFGADAIREAIGNGKHVILANAELDATVGPALKRRADRAGVVYSNIDGDQPGVLMNQVRFLRTIGITPVLAGNIKGLHDPYRTPETQRGFAMEHGQKPAMVTSFADGTKLSMEMAVVANATGFRVVRRGMRGPKCGHVTEAIKRFSERENFEEGVVDYILGAEPGPGVFVIGRSDDPIQARYLKEYKLGTGPYYLFYVPYHLPHVEAPLSAARAALFGDAAVAPQGSPVCEVVTIAKRDLNAGEALDGIGGFTAYGAIENSTDARRENLLPMGLSGGRVLKRKVRKDEAVRFDDVNDFNKCGIHELWEEQWEYVEERREGAS